MKKLFKTKKSNEYRCTRGTNSIFKGIFSTIQINPTKEKF